MSNIPKDVERSGDCEWKSMQASRPWSFFALGSLIHKFVVHVKWLLHYKSSSKQGPYLQKRMVPVCSRCSLSCSPMNQQKAITAHCHFGSGPWEGDIKPGWYIYTRYMARAGSTTRAKLLGFQWWCEEWSLDPPPCQFIAFRPPMWTGDWCIPLLKCMLQSFLLATRVWWQTRL